jgi:hypothetical protein
MEVKLVVVSGEAQAAEYVLNLPAIIGRSRTADIKLGHPLVSRKHCELYEADGQLAIRDLGSLNGTFIGETRIGEAMFLPPGGTVTIGAVTFQAIYGDMEDQAADADTGEMPDFMAAPAGVAIAAPIEQTIEMSETEAIAEESPEAAAEVAPAEAAGVDRDAGFDFGWLDDAAEGAESPATEPVAAVEESAEIEVVAEAAPEEELEFPDPPAAEEASAEITAETNGEVDSDNAFAPPEEEPAASGDDEDLSDFFASLK